MINTSDMYNYLHPNYNAFVNNPFQDGLQRYINELNSTAVRYEYIFPDWYEDKFPDWHMSSEPKEVKSDLDEQICIDPRELFEMIEGEIETKEE